MGAQRSGGGVQARQTGVCDSQKGTLLKKFTEGGNFNCYIEFREKEMAELALQANGSLFFNQHLRVDQGFKKQVPP